jgi:uncharacterized damage-inducible protein DinB
MCILALGQSTHFQPSTHDKGFLSSVQQHEIHHRGEIYLMLGLMGMQAPDV